MNQDSFDRDLIIQTKRSGCKHPGCKHPGCKHPGCKHPYQPPALLAELELETRAGSPLRLPPELLPPGSGPAGFEK